MKVMVQIAVQAILDVNDGLGDALKVNIDHLKMEMSTMIVDPVTPSKRITQQEVVDYRKVSALFITAALHNEASKNIADLGEPVLQQPEGNA